MRNQLVFKNHENGYQVAKILLDEGKVVMLSYEEELDELSESILNDVAKDYVNGTLGSILAPRIAKWKKDISSI